MEMGVHGAALQPLLLRSGSNRFVQPAKSKTALATWAHAAEADRHQFGRPDLPSALCSPNPMQVAAI